VIRVLSRVFRVDDASGSARPRIWDLAARLVRRSRPAELNQGLMELGATVCTPRNPGCDRCPIARACGARSHGDAERFPSGKTEIEVRPMHLDLAWIERDGRVLLVRRAARGLWANLWDLPGAETKGGDPRDRAEVARRIGEALGATVGLDRVITHRIHVLSHRRVHANVWLADATFDRVGEGGDTGREWVARDALPSRGTSTLLRKLWADVLEAARQPDLFPDRAGAENGVSPLHS
jgi:A/G-specific adenine glycosylase